MRPYSILLRGLACAAIVLPVAAQAQQAVVAQTANLRAGPGASYPVVAQLAPGTAGNVAGCTAGYRWCDLVLPDGNRGWVFARSLSYPYQGRPVPLAQYGSTIGIPLLTFALGSYWGSYYRDRPFYREPRWWGGRPPGFVGGGPRPGFHGGPPRGEFHGRPGGFHGGGGGFHGGGHGGGGHGGGHGGGGHGHR